MIGGSAKRLWSPEYLTRIRKKNNIEEEEKEEKDGLKEAIRDREKTIEMVGQFHVKSPGQTSTLKKLIFTHFFTGI